MTDKGALKGVSSRRGDPRGASAQDRAEGGALTSSPEPRALPTCAPTPAAPRACDRCAPSAPALTAGRRDVPCCPGGRARRLRTPGAESWGGGGGASPWGGLSHCRALVDTPRAPTAQSRVLAPLSPTAPVHV